MAQVTPQMPEYKLRDLCEANLVEYYPNHGSQVYEDLKTALGE